MTILAQPAQEWKTEYQLRSEATSARRRAAGRYARPTQAQEAAFKKSVKRDGRKSLTAAECDLLATHPCLAHSQRAEFAAMAQAATEREIAAMPETLADVTDAYTVGCADAEAGQPCEPLAHYAKLGDIEQYICGWKDTETALDAADDYAEHMTDVEFFRTGC